jgi:carbonic anhydrase
MSYEREVVMRRIVVVAVVLLCVASAWVSRGNTSSGGGASAKSSAPPTADQVLQALKAGNQRETSGKATHPHQSASWRNSLISGQHPKAVILTCADSRVPPELVFDQGLGDLFDIRVAGNIADDAVVGSIEYAVEHLHCPLVVVMGHQKCGAVSAAIEGGTPEGHLGALINPILPAVAKAKSMPGDTVANAVRINVDNVVEQLKTSEPILAEHVNSGHLKIVGAVYSLQTGKVSWQP